MSTTYQLIDMTSQEDMGAASQYISHIFKNVRSNPFFVLDNELNPMCSTYGYDMVANVRGWSKYKEFLA
jgi:hypothetical protein